MNKILIVVDMQKDFVDGALGTKEAVAVVPNVLQKIREYESAGDEVVFTMDTHTEAYMETLEGKNLPVKHCVKGTDGWKLAEALEEAAAAHRMFEKVTFGSLDCAAYVAAGGYESIELVGVCTDICVITNALLCKSYLPETPVRVDASCCAGVTPESHERALEAMAMCQIEIVGKE